jgi:hypothetical protein
MIMRLPRALAVLAFILIGGGTAAAAQQADCRDNAISKLKELAPDGFAIYQATDDKKFFLSWITCDDLQLGLATAVHESVHRLTAQHDAFPLIGGGAAARPHEASKFFAPAVIARKFKPDDFVKTYLRPAHSSAATDFLYLLDELNAYSHELNAAVALNSLRPAGERVDHRDGLAALMAFVAVYAETAQDSEPATWSGLQSPAVAKTVAALWTQAETVMSSSCGIPDFGSEDRKFIGQFCRERPQAALQAILGRAPVCPAACLQTAPGSAPQR